MRSPEEKSHQTIEDHLYEAFTFIEAPNPVRENKKAVIREKCLEIGTKLGLQGKLLAQYYFKLLDSNPERVEKFWEILHELHYHATDPEATAQNLTILSGLVDESGLTYLWKLAQGIIKGEYEVWPIEVSGTQGYFLTYRNKGDAKTQKNNPKRKVALKAAEELMEGSIVKQPLVGLRNQDVVGIGTEEIKILGGIFGTLENHVDTLLFAKEEIDDIFVYFEWVKTKLASIVDELGVSAKIKARYKLFIDTVVYKYLMDLYNYTLEMNEKENENELIRDIMNETFAIKNQTINDKHKEISPIETLRNDWNALKTNLTAFHQNPKSTKNTAPDSALNQTRLFTGDQTPVEGEPMPTKTNPAPAAAKGRTTFYIPSLQPAVKVVPPKPAPTPQVVAVDVNNLIKQTQIGMTALQDRTQPTPKPENDPLQTDVVKNTVSTDQETPKETPAMMPLYKNHGKMREHIANNGLIPRLHNYEKELNDYLNSFGNSSAYSGIENLLQRATDPLFIIQQKADELRKELDEYKKRRKEFSGGWVHLLKAKGRAANADMQDYFDQIDLVIEELWDKEITPTLQKLTAKYVNSPNVSQT